MVDNLENHIIKRFKIEKKIGKGAYGVVYKALDLRTKELIAIKKLYDAFRNSTDSQRTFREVFILQELNGHENIIRLLNVIKAENKMDLYLVFDYMETDLFNVIRANILQDIHKRFILYQLCKALKFIHSGDIIHRDIKPSNLFLNADCLVKLGDFGLARTLKSKENGYQSIVTDYVATRWYRAPEMLLGSPKYTKSVDMWSVGCILAELVLGKPLLPGKSTKHQLCLVFEVIDIPLKEEYNRVKEEFKLLLDYRNLPLKGIKKRPIKSIFSPYGKDIIDLISKLLVFDPNKRLTVEQVLSHPYLEQFHNEEYEYKCNRIVEIPLDDNNRYKVEDYRERLYEEVLKRKIEIRKKILEHLKSQQDK